MTDRVDLRNPYLAAVLAFLLPGLGHFYQRRWFKGVVYSVCILTLFFWGMCLGRWQVVYYDWSPGHRTVGYLAQVFVGLPALPALIQAKRWQPASDNLFQPNGPLRVSELERPLSGSFRGRLVQQEDLQSQPTVRWLEGRIELRAVEGEYGREVRGLLTGKLDGQEDVVLELSDPVEVGPRVCGGDGVPVDLVGGDPSDGPLVYPPDRRYVKCTVVDKQAGFRTTDTYVEGTVPRPVWNWYEVPLQEEALQDLHRRLGKLVELAQVLTWIAGLLNLLAIWDAFDGPAYGYGDEKEDDAGGPKSRSEQAEKGSRGVKKSQPQAEKTGRADDAASHDARMGAARRDEPPRQRSEGTSPQPNAGRSP